VNDFITLKANEKSACGRNHGRSFLFIGAAIGVLTAFAPSGVKVLLVPFSVCWMRDRVSIESTLFD